MDLHHWIFGASLRLEYWSIAVMAWNLPCNTPLLQYPVILLPCSFHNGDDTRVTINL